MSDFSEAFQEVKRVVQPDTDPKLTYGRGDEPDEDADLDKAILASARATVWQAGLVVRYGQRIVPTVGNGRKYKVTTAGTLGSTEPSWPGYDFGSVSTNGVTLEDDGLFEGNVYDIRRACYLALDLKVKRSADDTQFLNEGQQQAASYKYLNWVRERDKYRSVGVG